MTRKNPLTLAVVDGDRIQVFERSWRTVVRDDLDQLVGLTYSWEGIWENQEEGEDLRREKRILRKLRHKKLRRKAESWLSSWQVTLSEILILKDDPVLSGSNLGGLRSGRDLVGLRERKITLPDLKALVNSASFKWPRQSNHQLERQDMVLNDEILHLIFRSNLYPLLSWNILCVLVSTSWWLRTIFSTQIKIDWSLG